MFEVLAWTDAGEHQQVWRFNDTGGDDDLFFGAHLNEGLVPNHLDAIRLVCFVDQYLRTTQDVLENPNPTKLTQMVNFTKTQKQRFSQVTNFYRRQITGNEVIPL